MTKSLSRVASLLLRLLLPLLVAAAEPKKPLADVAVDPKKAFPRNAELADNINDPYYQNLGKFAVDEHNKQTNNHLRFQKVIDGSSQVVAGISYKLRLSAFDGVLSSIYGAVIFKDPSQNLHLKDFFGITRK